MFAAIASLTVLGLICGWLLGLAARCYLRAEVTEEPIGEQVEALLVGLPVWPMRQCGLPGW